MSECISAATELPLLPNEWIETEDFATIRSKIRAARYIYIKAEFGENVQVSRKTALEVLDRHLSKVEARICTTPYSKSVFVFFYKRGNDDARD